MTAMSAVILAASNILIRWPAYWLPVGCFAEFCRPAVFGALVQALPDTASNPATWYKLS